MVYGIILYGRFVAPETGFYDTAATGIMTAAIDRWMDGRMDGFRLMQHRGHIT